MYRRFTVYTIVSMYRLYTIYTIVYLISQSLLVEGRIKTRFKFLLLVWRVQGGIQTIIPIFLVGLCRILTHDPPLEDLTDVKLPGKALTATDVVLVAQVYPEVEHVILQVSGYHQKCV